MPLAGPTDDPVAFTSGRSGRRNDVTGTTPIDIDARWDPALVRIVMVIRTFSALSLAGACAVLPQLGPGRWGVALILAVAVPFENWLYPRVLSGDRVFAAAMLTDIVWCVVAVALAPLAYAAAMLVSIVNLAFVANESTRMFVVSSCVSGFGFLAVGFLQPGNDWIVLEVTYLLLVPLLVFMAMSQRDWERRHQQRIRHQVEHDALTGLCNRTGLSRAMRDASVDAVVAIDLDGFKDINDTLGHDAGDELLVVLTTRMREVVGEAGVLARTGGDEFTVLVRSDDVEADADVVAGDILRACRRRVALGDVDVSIGASIGVAFAEPLVTAVELLRRADLAMYEAKRSQGGVRRWSSRTQSASRRRVTLSGEVERGFEQGQFELHFQPIIDVATERVVDAEGLLRWRHPSHGLLSPADFLELVEGIGRRSTMDRVVFDQACELAALLAPHDVNISVNVSAGSLLRTSVPAVLDEALRRYAVDPSRLTVEVIEDEMVDDRATARAVLAALGEIGVGIAIDDFGTGHSSLSRLRRLPVTSLKIDHSFVSSMVSSLDDAAIVTAVSELGRALGLLVVAEGVEDLALRAHVLDTGLPIDRLQGFGIAAPMPRQDFLEWLGGRRTVAV
jgi:diguanylate cyclase (GGDEF)-like protein